MRRVPLLAFSAGFERVSKFCGASWVAKDGTGLAGMSVLAFGDGCGGSGTVGVGMGSSAGGMGALSGSLPLSWGVGSGCNESFAFVESLSRRSCIDLSNINFMAAAWCECSPDEELRIILESEAPSTDGFSLDWKSSCSISLICSWLRRSSIRAMGHWVVGRHTLQ